MCGEHQPCWKCAKATGGGDCPWANDLEPVPGWMAVPDKDSYKILWCPLFSFGEKGRND